jgi:hypothetical protein
MNVSIFVMSAMSRAAKFKRSVRQHTDEQRRNRVDYGLPLEPFALADL